MGSAAPCLAGSAGGQGAALAAPPSTATPVTGVAPQHPPAPVAAPALPHCLQMCRYGSLSHLEPSQPVAHRKPQVGGPSPMGGHACPAGPTVGRAWRRWHRTRMLSQWDFTPWWAPSDGLCSQVPSGGSQLAGRHPCLQNLPCPAGRDLWPEQSEFPSRAAPRPGEVLR